MFSLSVLLYNPLRMVLYVPLFLLVSILSCAGGETVIRITCDNATPFEQCDLNTDGNSTLLSLETLSPNACVGVTDTPGKFVRLGVVPATEGGRSIRFCVYENSTDCDSAASVCHTPISAGAQIMPGQLPYPLSPVEGTIMRYFITAERPRSLQRRIDGPACLASFGLDFAWGRWCGSGHGGFQNCCGGKPCPACDSSASDISQECFRQCPPIDLVDQKCAYHDLCTFRFDVSDYASQCSYAGNDPNLCGCDCELLRDLDRAICPPVPGRHPDAPYCAKAKICMRSLFEDTASCIFADRNNVYCNKQGYNHIPVREFC